MFIPLDKPPRETKVTLADGRLDTLAFGHLEHSSAGESPTTTTIFLQQPTARGKGMRWAARKVPLSSRRSPRSYPSRIATTISFLSNRRMNQS